MSETDLSQYSGFLRDVAEYCGPEIADEVHDRLKGTNFIVPLEVDETHVLWRLKPETRERFMEVFNSRERIYIPMKKQSFSRRELAKELAAHNWTHTEIGLELAVQRAGCMSCLAMTRRKYKTAARRKRKTAKSICFWKTSGMLQKVSHRKCSVR